MFGSGLYAEPAEPNEPPRSRRERQLVEFVVLSSQNAYLLDWIDRSLAGRFVFLHL